MEQWKKYLAEIGDLSIDPYPFKLHNAFPADDQYFMNSQQIQVYNIMLGLTTTNSLVKENFPGILYLMLATMVPQR